MDTSNNFRQILDVWEELNKPSLSKLKMVLQRRGIKFEEEDFKKLDLEKLSKMKEKFPDDYMDKLEVALMQHEQYITTVSKENK